MSVRANERNQGELTVIIKAKEMAAHTLRITNNEKNFPKRYRLTLTNKIVDKAFDIYTLLYEANELYPHNAAELEMRQNKQRQAMAYCRSLMAMRNSYNARNVNTDGTLNNNNAYNGNNGVRPD